MINQSNLPEEIIKSNIHFIIYGGKPDGEDCNVDILGGAGYGRYSPNRGVYYNKDNAQGLADHFTHELGHCLGLDDHSWVDGFCDTDGVKYESNNYMDYSEGRSSLTQRQLGVMHYKLLWTSLNKNAPSSNVIDNFCEPNFDYVIRIPAGEDIIWDKHAVVNENIEIEGTLTIKCRVDIAEDIAIFIKPGGKLIVDAGILTSRCENTMWKGIKVAGGNSDFDIKMFNEAKIQNTSEAAITMWPTDFINQPANGIALIENSTFNDVRGVVGFFAKSSSFNPSYVKDCTINNARWGISNTNCHNIEVSANTFNDTELECIFGSMASFNIHNNNTFRSYQQDILFMNTSPTLSSIIENNRFYGSNTGYHADGSVFAQNRIEFNQFFNGEIDILNDGHNSFRAWSNQLHAGFGSVSFSNGNTVGEYGFNTFENNFIAQLPVGSNPGFNFYENCYNSSFTDIYVDGSVASVIQQGIGDAANNCFTHQGNNSVIKDLGGDPDPFTYVEPNDHDLDCRDAINAHSNILREPIGSDLETPECYDPFTTPPTVPFSPCNPQEGQEEAARQWLLNKINEIENNPNLSESQKNQLLSIYRNCLKKVIGLLAELHVDLGEFDDARSLYQPELSDDDKVMVYGLYIMEGDLISASNYINSLSSESEQLMDFKEIQLSNLQRIQSNYAYEPSTSELMSIRDLAEKDHPYAAYAKALYYAYTGDVLVSNIPVFVQNELENRSSRVINQNKLVNISPNPFRDQLTISCVGLYDPSIKVYDIMGKHQYNDKNNLANTINTSTWSKGVYVVQVFDGTELIKTQKVVLVK